MPSIRLFIKQESRKPPVSGTVVVERIPVSGDYIVPVPQQLVRVRAVLLTPSGPNSADVIAVNDPDDFPDEAQ